jgi:hypothetical protein
VEEIWRVLRDPRVSTTLVLAALAAAGFGGIALGWRGAAATLFVVLQLPWVISGGFVGVALIGAGLALLITHLDRTEAAAERASLVELQRDALRLLSAAGTRAAGR